mmetsp:Transcript_36276/g.87851  ORF Transcript_36276/g.87851 Transcript_36276/m.87851 type:complete len:161 (+) Transcript_36276:1787-2269(+)
MPRLQNYHLAFLQWTLDLDALVHHVLEEDSGDGSMDVEEACGDARGEEGGTCIDRPQELQAVRGVGYVDPALLVGVVAGKGMPPRLESVVDMVGALMDDVRMEEVVEDDQKLLGYKDRSATVKQAATVDLEEFPLIASSAPAEEQLESICLFHVAEIFSG